MPPILKLPLTVPEEASTEPTVMFGVPLKPVAFPVTLPVKSPLKPAAAVVTPVTLTFA